MLLLAIMDSKTTPGHGRPINTNMNSTTAIRLVDMDNREIKWQAWATVLACGFEHDDTLIMLHLHFLQLDAQRETQLFWSYYG